MSVVFKPKQFQLKIFSRKRKKCLKCTFITVNLFLSSMKAKGNVHVQKAKGSERCVSVLTMTAQWYYVLTKSMQMLYYLVSFVSLSIPLWPWNVYCAVCFRADFETSGMRPKILQVPTVIHGYCDGNAQGGRSQRNGIVVFGQLI